MERGNFSFVSGAAVFLFLAQKHVCCEKKLQIGQKVICKTVAVAFNSVALLVLARFSQSFLSLPRPGVNLGNFVFVYFLSLKPETTWLKFSYFMQTFQKALTC